MAKKEEEPNPVDQLIDLFVYAPVGLLYEYQEVIPKLVKRGKSQVQIAKVIGQVAVKRDPSIAFNHLADGVANALARQITDIGAALGLAPPPPAGSDDGRTGTAPPPPRSEDQPPPPELVAGSTTDTDSDSDSDSEADLESEAEDRPLPIAGYDDLKAKEIIGLLDDLEPSELERIRAHEEANRARKTVLGKLDRLAS